MERYLENEAATLKLGAELAAELQPGSVVFLHGELGAGKTTLVRGLLQAKGHPGAVKSPTYTLVEPYSLEAETIYHFDLYRLGDAEELEYMGGRDYFSSDSICLVEWPQRGEGWLPTADLEVFLRHTPPGRQARLLPHSAGGQKVIERLLSHTVTG